MANVSTSAMQRIVPVLLMVTTVLSAQVVPRVPRPESQSRTSRTLGPPATVSGQVVSVSGEPLRKASVSLSPGGGTRNGSVFEATTDNAGAFRITDVPAGTYSLSAQRNGYVRADSGQARSGRGRGTMVNVNPGQELTGITLKMQPHAVITGKVVDEDGDPLIRANVQVLVERYTKGKREWTPAQGVPVNDLGEYRIAGLRAGKYHVTANANRGSFASLARRTQGSDLRYVATYYPGVSDPGQAAPVQLSPGQEARGIDFQLRKSPTVRVRGRVIDAQTGMGVRGAHVMLLQGDTGFNISRSIGMARDEEGNFEIAGVTPGTYTLLVNQSQRGESNLMGELPVQVGTRDLEGVVVPLQRPVDVSGTVRVQGQENAQFPNMRIMLDPVQGRSRTYGGPVEAGGAVRITGVPSSRYRLSLVNPAEGIYLKSVRVAGQEAVEAVFDIGAGASLEITLGTNAPQVAGIAQDDKQQPAAGATVVLVPEAGKRDRYWLYRTSSSDQNGAFSLRGIPPGDYTVIAFNDVDEGIWHNPDFLKQHESRGSALKLAEGARETVQLKVVQ